jgi:hypothetical protein
MKARRTNEEPTSAMAATAVETFELMKDDVDETGVWHPDPQAQLGGQGRATLTGLGGGGIRQIR